MDARRTIFFSLICLVCLWTITNIVILGVYADKEISIEETSKSLGIVIITQNVLTIVTFILWLLLMHALTYSSNYCCNCSWDLFAIIDVILAFISYVFSWGVFTMMCSLQKCFYFTTPLYVMTLIYWAIIGAFLFGFLMWMIVGAFWGIPACRNCCLKCSEKCKWWCCGIKPRWMVPEPVVVEGKAIKLVVKN